MIIPQIYGKTKIEFISTLMNQSAAALLLFETNHTTMKDPKEEEVNKQAGNAEDANPQEKADQDPNYDEHKQVDEEGTELDPGDIK